jgi:hypothetical protein
VARARNRATRERLRGGSVWLWRLAYADGTGQVVDRSIIAVRLAAALRRPHGTRDVPHVTSLIAKELDGLVDDASREWREHARRLFLDFLDMRIDREQAIDAAVGISESELWQAGLFDRRANLVRLALDTFREERKSEAARRIWLLQQARAIADFGPVLTLVLTS